MKTKKKNRFLTFCFSLVRERQKCIWGYEDRNRAGAVFPWNDHDPSFLGLEGLSILAVVIWAYGFFPCQSSASLSDEEFAQVEDNDILGMELFQKGKKKLQGNSRGIAVLLIVLGIWLLWGTGVDMLWAYRVLPEYIYELLFTISDYVPRLVASVLIIVLGVHMIRGKKKELYREEPIKDREQEAADQSAASENPDREGEA